MICSGSHIYFIINELEKESEESDDKIDNNDNSYERIESASWWGEIHEKYDRENRSYEESYETSVYREENVPVVGKYFGEKGSSKNIYENMKEKGKYKEIWLHPIDIDVEWRYQYKEKDGEDCHLPKNDGSFPIF